MAEAATYSIDTIANIILACYIFHNYFLEIDPDPQIWAKVNRELVEQKV